MIRRAARHVRALLTSRPGPDLAAELARVNPRQVRAIGEATEATVACLPEPAILDALADHSPALRGFDWRHYLEVSALRIAHALRLLEGAGVHAGARLLDYGSYFGNFSIAAARAGYRVSACDAYGGYGDTLAAHCALLRDAGLEIIDSSALGHDLASIASSGFDAVMCMGVIEHVPHTPRGLLETLDRMLAPGGVLVLDTPNLAYSPNRARLARGESPFAPIEVQFDTAVPFEGHHREYTAAEVEWMLHRIGHDDVRVELFDYSVYTLARLDGEQARDFRRRRRDPSLREVIITASRKPAGA